MSVVFRSGVFLCVMIGLGACDRGQRLRVGSPSPQTVVSTPQGCGPSGEFTGPSSPPPLGTWTDPPTQAMTGLPSACPTPAARPIAHWDMVPFREFSGVLNVGVVAAHHLGIAEVRFWYTQAQNYQQVFSGPPQVVVNQRTFNPQVVPSRDWGPQQTIPVVPVREYWFPLDAAALTPNVPVRVKAVVVPNSSCPAKTVLSPADSDLVSEALDHLVLTPNPSARQVYYADQQAPESNATCTSTERCRTIGKVLSRIQATAGAQGLAEALGRAEIRLGPSVNADWDLQGIDSSPFANVAQNRWLIIRSDPAVAPAQVRMRPGSLSWSVNLTSYQRMVMKEPASSSRLILGPTSPYSRYDRRYVWFHQVGVVGDCLSTIANGENWDTASPQTFIGSYLTDSFLDYMVSGPRNLTLIQNVYALRTGDGHASGSQTVVNYTLHTAYGGFFNFGDLEAGLPRGPGYHGDYYQAWGRRSNIMIQGGRYNPGGYLYLRGIVGTAPAIHSDIGIVDTVLDSTVSIDQANQWVFSFCARQGDGISSGVILDHLVVEDSALAGSNGICGESSVANFFAANFRNIGYHNSLWGTSAAWSTTPPLPWALPSVFVFPN